MTALKKNKLLMMLVIIFMLLNNSIIYAFDLEEKISNELLYGSTLTDEKVEYEKIDNETINVKLEMDFIQNIATSQPISADTEGEEILDKQTD